MMKGPERGMRSPFAMRVGINLPRWRGTNTLGDASSCADDEFRALENVEHDGNKWVSRDGLAKVNSAAAMTGSVYGIWDESDGGGGGSGLGLGGPVRLYGGVNNNAANLIYAYDSGLSTVGQQFKVNPAESSFGAMLALHEEFAQFLPTPFQAASEGTDADNEARVLLGGTNGQVYMWRPPFIPQGKALLDVAPSPMLLFQCPGLSASDDITSFVMWAGVLFIASDDGTGVKVFSFDGKTITLEDTIASVDTGILGAWHGQIYCASNAQSIRQRAWDGTWSSLTFPASVTAFIPRQILEYGGNLYFAGQESSGGTGEIMSWDGTTLTATRSIFGDTKILAMEISNDKLCYLHSDDVTFYAVYGGGVSLWGYSPPAALTLIGPNQRCDPLIVDNALMYFGDQPVDVAGTWTLTLFSTPAVGIGGTFAPTTLGTIAVSSSAQSQIWDALKDGSDILVYVYDGTRDPGLFYAWDGATLTSEGDTSATSGNRYNSVAATGALDGVLCSIGGRSHCLVTNRDPGAPEGYVTIFTRDVGGGSWSVLIEYDEAGLDALGGWTPDSAFPPQFSGGVVYDGKVWFQRSSLFASAVGYPNEMWSFDGSALAMEHSIAGSEPAASSASSPNPFVFNSLLYYGWRRDSDGKIMLGQYDGSTWSDSHHNTTITGPTGGTQLQWMLEVDGDLWIILVQSGGAIKSFKSDGTDTTSWTVLGAGGNGRSFVIE